MLSGCGETDKQSSGPASITPSGTPSSGVPTAAAGGASTGPGSPTPSSTFGEQAEAVAKLLGDTWPRGAGGTVVTARDGELVGCQGMGPADQGAGRAADCDTVYDIGSITKSFTAAAVLKLEMSGTLRVTDAIGAHLDPVPADKRGITIHHLLTHTSGLPEGIGDDYDPVSRDAMIATAMATPLESTPGREYAYSNVGYSLLAAIVERVSGVAYDDYLTRHVFHPAGMTRTGYALPDPRRGDVAVEYDEQGASQGRPFEHPWAPDGRPYWNLRGNGGLLSTARDMYLWYRALEGESVLNAAAKAKMFTPHVAEGGGSSGSYGYGWTILPTDHGPIATHDGGNDWSFARVLIRPGDRTLVFWATNTAVREGGWDLEEQDEELTLGLLAALSTGSGRGA
ncbi:serine hydrolase domain-containing protein [Yinghuangia sp. YIM S10712]|uniref:serine hydrolase domain-containing protein n=1 Tax=Yinghuangia sp. YIM S10712 TaxID=3436930 RepID=UPI003F52D2B7